MKYVTVITSINPVNEVTRAWAKTCEVNQGQLVVVGDRKSPKSYDLPGCKFIPYDDALPDLKIKSYQVTPLGSYARKNLGYLWAFYHKAPVIYETDDDNAPLKNWELRSECYEHTKLSGDGWCNMYRVMGEASWPRGFSLGHIHSQSIYTLSNSSEACPIQQGMIYGDSDVDAIYRLTNGKDLCFSRSLRHSLDGLWCPFNSQSTWWWPSVYPLMYLPVTCPMRVTDIWRSFVAQRCLRAVGKSVLYHSPAEVIQVRNAHNLMADFAEEISLYLHADQIATGLDALELGQNLVANIRTCYEFFVAKKLLQPEEMTTLNAWLEDCKNLC